MNYKRHLSHIVFAFLAYCFLIALFLSPLLTQFRSIVFGGSGDSLGIVYGMWAQINGYLDSRVNPLLAAPFGWVNNSVEIQPLYHALTTVAAKIFGEIGGYNFVVLLSSPSTAFCTFLLFCEADLQQKL